MSVNLIRREDAYVIIMIRYHRHHYTSTLVLILPLQTFAIRFASSEIAKEFKEHFIAGQGEMTSLLAGEDSKEGAAEADEVVAAIESLAVKGEDVKAEEA